MLNYQQRFHTKQEKERGYQKGKGLYRCYSLLLNVSMLGHLLLSHKCNDLSIHYLLYTQQNSQ